MPPANVAIVLRPQYVNWPIVQLIIHTDGTGFT